MIQVTPANRYGTYTNQDCDERQALLCDLQANPGDYLAHADAEVRSLADWTMEHWGIRNIRQIPGIVDTTLANVSLGKLYKRLRQLAAI